MPSDDLLGVKNATKAPLWLRTGIQRVINLHGKDEKACYDVELD
jgi:hypothetical protein